VQPQFSPDGAQIWFIDKPAENQPSGLWGVDVFSGGAPFFVTDKLGVYSADRSLVAYPENGQAMIERVATGERWVAPSGGHAISFSPNASLIAWSQAIGSGAFDQRLTEIWIANVDGSAPRRAARLLGGGFSGWFPDSARLLVSGREAVGDEQWFLAALTLADESLTTIVRGPRLRGGNLSPNGTWAAFQLQFSGEPEQDGLWLARTDGAEARRLDIFGAYRWRDDAHLLVVPLELNAGGQRFVEVEAATGAQRPLTDPALTPIHIANGDWALSPDGRRVAFVNAADRNVWVLELIGP
jgi:Tol biopolymer transport system component